MLRATNIVKAKEINLWVVFESIRVNGPIPRTRIAEMTGLSKQAISSLVDELIELGFAREEKVAERKVGKPPKPVSVNAKGAFTVGLHVDFGTAAGVVMNLDGEVLLSERRALAEMETGAVAAMLAELADELVVASGIDRTRFHGIGLASPGPFGVGGISPPRLPGWDGAALARALRQIVGDPVALANDGQCAITAEWRFGAVARKLSNFVYIYLGNGLGTGIMVDGTALSGARGNAGEFGHTIADPEGPPCICGKRGCLETFVSIDSLMRHLAARNVPLPTPALLADELSPTDPHVADWIDDAIEPLRTGINTLENLFDPETIMLGGDAPGWLLETLVERVQPLHPSIATGTASLPRLMKSELGADAVLRGAATLPILALLDPRIDGADLNS